MAGSLCAIALGLVAAVFAPWTLAAADGLDVMREVLVDVAEDPAKGFAAKTLQLVARAELGALEPAQIERALAEIPPFLERRYGKGRRPEADVWPFFAAVERLVYLQGRGYVLSPELRGTLRQALLPQGGRPSDRLVAWAGEETSAGGVLNQRLLWASGGYALGRLFNDELEIAFAEDWLRRMAASYLEGLTWESDSDPYEVVYLRGWLLVLRSAPPAEFNSIPRMVLDRMLTSLAAKFSSGLFCGISTRDKIPISTPDFKSNLHGYLNALLLPQMTVNESVGAAVRLAAVDYKAPKVATALAQAPGVVEAQEYFESYPYARWVEQMPPLWRNRWIFKRPSHVLGSMGHPRSETDAANEVGYRRWFHTLHWKLCWNEDGRFGHLFMTHPSAEVRELPGRPRLWASPAEWTVQHRNTLASLYVLPENLPEGAKRHLEGLVPFSHFDESVQEGRWLLFRVRRLLVALYVHNGIERLTDGLSYFGRGYEAITSPGYRNAVVLTVFESEDLVPGGTPAAAFARFRALIREQARIAFNSDANPPRLRATLPALAANGKDIVSAVLELRYGESRRIDGREIAWLEHQSRYRVSPWMSQGQPWKVVFEPGGLRFEGSPPADLR